MLFYLYCWLGTTLLVAILTGHPIQFLREKLSFALGFIAAMGIFTWVYIKEMLRFALNLILWFLTLPMGFTPMIDRVGINIEKIKENN